MSVRILYRILTICLAIIWLFNGLFCKVLNLVPRHQQIVARILGDHHSLLFTILIGIAEIIIAIWVLSTYRSKLSAIVQVVVIGTMNVIEFFVASDLLLWGRFNLLFAVLLMSVIYLNEFHLKTQASR